jgi:hypothetical protein
LSFELRRYRPLIAALVAATAFAALPALASPLPASVDQTTVTPGCRLEQSSRRTPIATIRTRPRDRAPPTANSSLDESKKQIGGSLTVDYVF